MIDSLKDYELLCAANPEDYVDRSGLFEILESAYIQLCQNDPWFNAYTEYSYYNVIRVHQVEISKLIDLEGNKHVFSKITLRYRMNGKFEISRYDYSYAKNTVHEVASECEFEFGSGSFLVVLNYLRDWFSEILISVKNYKHINTENE